MTYGTVASMAINQSGHCFLCGKTITEGESGFKADLCPACCKSLQDPDTTTEKAKIAGRTETPNTEAPLPPSIDIPEEVA